MPVNFRPLVPPTPTNSIDPNASNRASRYMFFKPQFGETCRLFKPAYDTRTKGVTVFRPFPCASFEKPDEFVPYRIDPGGTNLFGFWLKRVYAAWDVGRPKVSFIVHDMDSKAPFDSRQIPLSILFDAVKHAIARGQGKAADWGNAIRRPYEPSADVVLDWTGYKEGGVGESAPLSYAKEICLMQGMVMQMGGVVQAGPGKAIPGWTGTDYTCVFALTQQPMRKLFSLLSEENQKFRGNPADFEARYVHGDPVSLNSGRFIYVYPFGGDPRQQQMASVPAGDIYAAGPSRGIRSTEEEKIGYDLHLDKTFNGHPAKLLAHKKTVYEKWQHWDDLLVRGENNKPEVNKGILWYPTPVEQARILSNCFPAQMLEYAFFGGHNDWLDEDTLKRSRAARSASVPAAPPTTATSAGPTDNPFGDGTPWGASLAEEEAPTQPASSLPASHVQQDATLAPPADLDLTDASPQSIDDVFNSMAAPEDDDAASIVADDVSATEASLNMPATFDTPPLNPQLVEEQIQKRTAETLAALAAAKAASRVNK